MGNVKTMQKARRILATLTITPKRTIMEKRKNPLNPAAQNQERVAVKKQPLQCNWYSTIKNPLRLKRVFYAFYIFKSNFHGYSLNPCCHRNADDID